MTPARPTILIVEDEGIVANDLKQTLVDMGYDAFAIADSAEEAIVCAEGTPPDLVLMDIRIKGRHDGIHTAELLRDRFRSAVIYLTAHADEQMVQRAKKTEPYGYLLKPVKTAELRSMIEIALYRNELQGIRERAAQLEFQLARSARELSSRNARLRALIDVNLQLASEHDPHSLLEKVCLSAKDLLGATYAVLVVDEKQHDDSVFCTTSGIERPPSAPRLPIPSLTAGPLGEVYRSGQVWRARRDPQALPLQVLPAGYPLASAYLAAPICSLTRTYGWLCLADKLGSDAFSQEDERVLGILAGQVGRIYENGSLYHSIQLHAAQLQVEMDERERGAAALRSSEERFRQLAENIQDVFFILSADLRELIYLSPAFSRIWGRPPDLTNPLDWTESIHGDDRPRILDQLESHANQPGNDQLEFRIVQPSGAIRWILARYFPLHDGNGRPYRLIGVATDITDRKQAETKIQHLNRVYAVLSGINALIIRARTPIELFTEACRLAVEQGDFRLAWIGSFGGADNRIIPVAWAGDDVVARCTLDNTPVSIGLDAEAIQRQTPAVCNDLETESHRVRYQEDLIARGLRSVVTLPLVVHETTVGCLVLATDAPGFFNAAEMRLLVELAGDISFALDHLKKTERLNYLAYYDALTGLANRTLFVERLTQHVNAAKHNNVQFAVVIRDPERFETINEMFGHDQGDVLLKAIADRFAQSVGDQDTVARIAPGQFAAVIHFVGAVDAAARVLEAQYQSWLDKPFSISGNELILSARAGISIYPVDGQDAESLLKNADAALKRASSIGERNVFFTPEISVRIAERLSMETRLRQALVREEFVLHYQPKVDLESRQVEGLEALIRWQSPELGLVPPIKFIPLMEETGMIVDVGAWVLRQACGDRLLWLEQGLDAPRIAVNVSTVQLRQPDFVGVFSSTLKNALRDALLFGGPRAGIDIEVTESLFVENADSNMGKLRALRDLGVGIAIDDFGTGYSSLGYLAQMKVDSLKIDRSFISAMLDDPSVMTLVSTMITLAHSLKLQIVAEGVESEEQAKILRLLRCDQMQGYLISEPLTLAEMTKWLARAPKGAR